MPQFFDIRHPHLEGQVRVGLADLLVLRLLGPLLLHDEEEEGHDQEADRHDQRQVPLRLDAVRGRPISEHDRAAEQEEADAVFIDTAGRLHIDQELMEELSRIKDSVMPHEILFVADAMTGQEAVTLASKFDQEIEGTGIVVTKTDSDTRGGAMLSVREVTGLPIKLITTGENLEAIEDFHPDRIASRILGMGDVVSLVEKAKEVVSERDMKNVTQRMKSGQFNLEDFLVQMQQMKNMGPLSGLLEMLPGGGQMAKQMTGVNLDESFFAQSEAIVLSMTPEERRNPDILNGSRRRRIAKGAGTSLTEVNRLLNQFKDAKKLMQAMTSGKGAGGLGKLLGF